MPAKKILTYEDVEKTLKFLKQERKRATLFQYQLVLDNQIEELELRLKDARERQAYAEKNIGDNNSSPNWIVRNVCE